MSSRLFACALSLLLFSGLLSSQAAASLLKPKLLDSESYGETWTAIADLEDGGYVLLQYVFTNAGMGDGKGACRVLVVPPGKKGQNAAARVDRDEWSYDAGKKSLKVGDCTLSSRGGRTTFSARAERLSVRLTLREGLKRVRPPRHRVPDVRVHRRRMDPYEHLAGPNDHIGTNLKPIPRKVPTKPSLLYFFINI